MNILIVRFSAIGDCVMAGHVVNDLRTAYPDANIQWVVDERCAGVVGKTSSCLALPRAQWKKRGELRTLFEQYRWHASLRRFGFDYGFDLQGHSKTAWCLRLSGAKKRLSARATDGIARILNPILGSQPSDCHDVEWARKVVGSLLPSEIAPGDFLPGVPLEKKRDLVTICTGAGHPLKQIPVSILQEVAQNLIQNGKQVVALGGPKDPLLEVEGVHNLVGKTTLQETIDWVRQSEIHLAGDTGTGHIAAAVGTRLVTVWGNMPFAKYRPYTQDVSVIDKEGKPVLVTASEILNSMMGSALCTS